MAVYVSWSVDPGIVSRPISPTTEADYLRRVGDANHRAADIMLQLAADGWWVSSSIVGVSACHPAVRTHAEARKRLSDLVIDPNECSLQTMPIATIRKLFRVSERSDAANVAPEATGATK